MRIPADLKELPSGCGIVCAWYVLHSLGISPSKSKLCRYTRYSPINGVKLIGVGVALARYGLTVTFNSDEDDRPGATERRLLKEARELGISFKQPLSIERLSKFSDGPVRAVILYELEGKEPHISPVGRIVEGKVYLPLDAELFVPRLALEGARQAPGIFRQSLLCQRSQ